MGTVELTSRTLGKLATQLHDRSVRIPEIQRDFVWSRTQICTFFDSLYRGYPFTSLLLWETDIDTPSKEFEGSAVEAAASKAEYVLDGQQRMTAIFRVLYDTEVDIRFNVDSEEFAAYKSTMANNPSWVSVRELWNTDPLAFAVEHGFTEGANKELLPRLSAVHNLQNRLATIEKVSGFDLDAVTEIFIRINSQGTQLAGVDLAMALLALRLPDEFQRELTEFSTDLELSGWQLDKGTLIRCLVATATGEARFARLRNRLQRSSDTDSLRNAWRDTKDAVETLLTVLAGTLGVESLQWVTSKNALVVPVAYLAKTPKSERDLNGTLRWFLLSLAWQRYGAGAEGRLKQDLDTIADSPDPFVAMANRLAQQTGRNLDVTAEELAGGGTAGRRRFLLHAYIASRRNGAQDWSEGTVLKTTNLGTQRALEQHHIFPQAVIRGRFEDENVDELANIAFLSKAANLQISKDSPMDYLRDVDADRLAQQFVPVDEALWTVDAFPAFLQERRRLLADGINAVINDSR